MNSKVSPPLFQDILTVDHDGCPLLLEVNRHFYRIVPHRGVESHGHDDDDLRGIRVPMEIELYLGRFQPQLEISVVVPVVGKSQSSVEIGVIDHSQVLKNGGLVPIGHYSHSTGVGLNGGLGKVEKGTYTESVAGLLNSEGLQQCLGELPDLLQTILPGGRGGIHHEYQINPCGFRITPESPFQQEVRTRPTGSLVRRELD